VRRVESDGQEEVRIYNSHRKEDVVDTHLAVPFLATLTLAHVSKIRTAKHIELAAQEQVEER